MHAVRTLLVYAAALAAGVVLGVWTAGMTYITTCFGLCNEFLVQRFAWWQSALFGAALLLGVVGVATVLSREFRGDTVGVVRWLNHDLLREGDD